MRTFLIVIALAIPGIAQGRSPPDPDTDKDGLSDFLERHKHLTDPAKADSDGDGIPDGDWAERREYAYTVRTIVQVMKPVTKDVLADDWQDARILDEGPEHVELEVIHYPLATVADEIGSDEGWRKQASWLRPWLAPGPTSGFDEAMKADLLRELRAAGIDVSKLGDREVVERASKWLCERAAYQDGFTTFSTLVENGRASVPDVLREAAERGIQATGRTLEEQWDRELFAAGMYRNRTRGSCTSSAIYLGGCLRAIGIPTRIVLCIPAVDASDDREVEMVRRRITHPLVRKTLLEAVEAMRGSWSSHTFNEVWVAGRWRRLNYGRLGQGILDAGYLGLMTHVATFADWAEARMPDTIGRRQSLDMRDDLFGGPNPYSTLTIGDRAGPHSKVTAELDAGFPEGLSELTIEKAVWSDDPSIDESIRKNLAEGGGLALLVRPREWNGWDPFKRFTEEVDGRFHLEADGCPTLSVAAATGGITNSDGSTRWAIIRFGPADIRDLKAGVAYRLRPRNGLPGRRWVVPDGFTVVR